jgi:hypothetical protein
MEIGVGGAKGNVPVEVAAFLARGEAPPRVANNRSRNRSELGKGLSTNQKAKVND